MQGRTAPALEGGAKALKDNVEFGQEVTKETVKPEEIANNFAESAQF